jgi:hypothetical protein
MSDTCHVADQFCLAPANLEPRRLVWSECVRCGNAVCMNCSLRTRYLHRSPRLCHDCIIELDPVYGKRRVTRHLQRLANNPASVKRAGKRGLWRQ